MKDSDNDKVNRFMDDLQSISLGKLEMIESIRKIFLGANKELTEDIKYGGLVFNLSNTLIGGIFPYKEHISIEFSNGAEFPDPSGLLEGKGKKRRHLKIVEKQDIDAKNVEVFVAESVKN
jgi:hypothetical protein